MTEQVVYLFRELERHTNENRSPRQLQKEITDFFLAIGPRGFLTCLGLRKTVSS